VASVVLPNPRPAAPRGIYERSTRGARIYLKTPRLRGLLALTMAVSAAGAMVIVNTVVLVQSVFGLDQQAMAVALAAFGGGSMAAALVLPRLLDNVPDRPVMMTGAGILILSMLAGTLLPGYVPLLVLWALIGIGYSVTQTPSGRLIRRSSRREDRPALFAAQFALSHATWLITYPLAGWLGATAGMPVTFLVMALLAAAGLALALRLWPATDSAEIEHVHDLPADHPHLAGAIAGGNGHRHTHDYVIDAEHASWPEL
jgi:predicted MFS family arabinose efflux permease